MITVAKQLSPHVGKRSACEALQVAQHVKHIRCLKESVAQMEKEIALNLAQTQGAFLTSVRGIGLVLAAGVTAEIGELNKQKPLNNLASYAGIIPRVKQSGGLDGKTYTGAVGNAATVF